jgi:UDPglucose 6-dehydrogenase
MSPRVIGFAGMTHLGINSAAACAGRGFHALCYDPDGDVIGGLAAGRVPVVEPGLPELLRQNAARIRFSGEPRDLETCDVVYIAADVPTDEHGASDLTGIEALIGTVAARLGPHAVLVVLCQVPPGFTRRLALPAERVFYQVETLVFGRAVERALNPERIIVGCANPARELPVAYGEFLAAFGCPVLKMRYESAELAKIAINCCLVASVTVANTLAELSEKIGADWSEIAPALKLDRRIGEHAYLAPGLGLAGGNLERDLATVLRLSGETGSESSLVRAFLDNSGHRRDWVLRTLHAEVLSVVPGAVIGVLGLAYKEDTHSTRNSPALALIGHLASWQLRIHDPVVPAEAARHPRTIACSTALEAATGADALAIMTPWRQFRELDVGELARVMHGHTVIDPYRALNGTAVSAAGLDYFTLGAGALRGTGRAARHA